MMPPVASAPAAVVLVSTDDGWEVLKPAADILTEFGVRWERADGQTPVGSARDRANLVARAVIVASCDDALPGQWSAATGLPTIRVPAEGGGRTGLALLRTNADQLPAGPPNGEFATMAIGAAGARNAALFIVAVLAVHDAGLRERWTIFRQRQTAAVRAEPAPTLED